MSHSQSICRLTGEPGHQPCTVHTMVGSNSMSAPANIHLSRLLLSLFFAVCIGGSPSACTGSLQAQTPEYWLHDPVTAGVNNTAFHGSICQKFLGIYGAAEWAAAGLPSGAPVLIDRIWFRSNTASPVTLSNLNIWLGEASSTVPVPTFNSNFDVSGPDLVLADPSYTVSFLPGTWSDPTDQWTAFDLATPFAYSTTDNLVLMVEFSGSSFPIPLYAASPIPIPINALAGTATSSATTWRPMFGISLVDEVPDAGFEQNADTLCAGACLSLTDTSLGGPSAWAWSFPGASPATASVPNPSVCFPDAGTWPFELVVSNATGSDTAFGVVEVLPVESPDLGADTAICQGERLTLSPAEPPSMPLWNDGSSADSLLVSEAGWYWLQAQGLCGERDSLRLELLPVPELAVVPQDGFLCTDSSLTLRLEGEWPAGTQFVWTGGSTNSTLMVDGPGLYAVTADAAGCMAEASAVVEQGPCGCSWTMPNAFTPNGDGRNDVFRPVLDCTLEGYRLDVFNRWGRRVFQSSEPGLSWDGSLAGAEQEAGVYVWVLEATVQDRGQRYVERASGSVTLLR